MTTAFEGFEGAVCSAVPLATATWLHVGGPAEHFVEPRSLEELAALAARSVRAGIPMRVLGGGSNLLVSDRGVSGAVFRLSQMRTIEQSGDRLLCDAGAPLPAVLRQAARWGLAGLEPLSGIPGTIGGAVAMNAGGKHGSIASVLRSVTTLTRRGSLRTRTPAQLGLRYRHSNLQGEVVVRAELELVRKDPDEIRRASRALLAEKAKTQPLGAWSAGCVFKNPGGMTAGELIDGAGLKGKRVGHAVVSGRHANFIINEGGASADDVRALINKIRTKVRKMFGVELELEIEVWN